MLGCAGIIKHGGVKPNIIPDYSQLEYYLRTPSRFELPVLKAKAERCFRSAAVATGCEVRNSSRNTDLPFLPLRPNSISSIYYPSIRGTDLIIK